MTSKEFLDYLKLISEKDAISILDNMNEEASRMANELNPTKKK